MWWIIAGAVLAIGAVCLIRSEYERKHIVTTVYSVCSEKLGTEWNGYTICFLTDLHNNTFGKKGLELLEEKIAQTEPDLILVGGDMMCSSLHNMPDFGHVQEFLIALAGRYPVIYALGNHEKRMRDYTDYVGDVFAEYRRALEEAGVKWLINESLELSSPSFPHSRIRITGLDMDWCYYVSKGKIMQMVSGYMEKTLGKKRDGLFEILLPHSPLYLEEYADWGADLILAGHFHGGTIRLPFFGGVMSPQFQFFCGRDRGSYSQKESRMIVSGGLGTHSINLRLNNPSELVVVRLESASQKKGLENRS